MKIANHSKNIGFRMQKAAVILAPPIIAGCGLLVNLSLLSIALITIASVVPASLYNRHLTAVQQEDTSEVIEDKSHAVVYKTPEGPQIIAFYKIIRRPQGYSLHTLKATFANSNLTIYPMLHTNGPFLAIRFSDKRYQNQKYLILEAPQLLEKLVQTIMQKFSGLELTPAASTDVKTLMSIFGGQSKDVVNHQELSPRSDQEQDRLLTEKLRLSMEHLANLPREQ